MGKDYYQILGVDKNVDQNTLKKSYRKLCMKWHPDKNKDNQKVAEEKFKEIAEAYDVLSDPEKRKIYDQFGEDGLKNGPQGNPGGGYHFNFQNAHGQEDLLKDIFGGSNPFGSFFSGNHGGSQRVFHFTSGGPNMGFHSTSNPNMGMGGFNMGTPGPRKANPIYRDIFVDLKELFHGTQKKLKITRNKFDQSTGRTYNDEEILTLDIKPGWKEGTKITFENKGDERPGLIPADIVFVIKDKSHPVFKRVGNDIIINKTITLKEALCGTSVMIDTLDDRKLKVNIRDVVTPEYQKVVSNEGMPISKVPGSRGDMIINFTVTWPKTLTDEQKEKISKILS